MISEIHSFPWKANSLLEMEDGEFKVTKKIMDQVKEESSIYGTPKQKTVFDQQAEMLKLLNAYCEQFVTFPTTVNEIADRLLCKAVRESKEDHLKIVPNHRALLHLMERGTSNL